jgi:hypothetical protein
MPEAGVNPNVMQRWCNMEIGRSLALQHLLTEISLRSSFLKLSKKITEPRKKLW